MKCKRCGVDKVEMFIVGENRSESIGLVCPNCSHPFDGSFGSATLLDEAPKKATKGTK